MAQVAGGGRRDGGQAGAVLQVEVQGAVTVHDRAVARSLSVAHRGQRADVHITVQEVAVHGGHRTAFIDHQVFHNVVAHRDRMVALFRHGLVDEGIAGNAEHVGLVAHRHEGDVVGAGRTGAAVLEHIIEVAIRQLFHRKGGWTCRRRQGEGQSHGKEQYRLHDTEWVFCYDQRNA